MYVLRVCSAISKLHNMYQIYEPICMANVASSLSYLKLLSWIYDNVEYQISSGPAGPHIFTKAAQRLVWRLGVKISSITFMTREALCLGAFYEALLGGLHFMST